MSNEQEVPFWRKPLPPIPGPRGELVNAEPEPVSETSPASVPEEPAPPVNLYDAAKGAEHALDLARAEARERRTATASARAAFAKALERWNHSQPIQTQEQALRDYVNQSNADRARRVAAGQGVYHPGITRTAKAMSGGNQQRGGGASYKRGAFTRAQAMEIEAGKLRAAATAAAAKPRG